MSKKPNITDMDGNWWEHVNKLSDVKHNRSGVILTEENIQPSSQLTAEVKLPFIKARCPQCNANLSFHEGVVICLNACVLTPEGRQTFADDIQLSRNKIANETIEAHTISKPIQDPNGSDSQSTIKRGDVVAIEGRVITVIDDTVMVDLPFIGGVGFKRSDVTLVMINTSNFELETYINQYDNKEGDSV